MSKYIRTKNEIIYVGDLVKDEYGNYCKPETIETDMEVSRLGIIKEADTIEELCDEFVVDSKVNNSHYTMSWFDYLCEELADDRLYSTDVIYGAIWTDKGLIYVAKLNDEGVLELL